MSRTPPQRRRDPGRGDPRARDPRRRERRRRYRRALLAGMAASVVLHAALAWGWRGGPGPGLAGASEAAARRAPARWERDAVRAVALADPPAEREVEVPPPPRPVTASAPEVAAPEAVRDATLVAGELTPRSAGPPGEAGGAGPAGDGRANGGGSIRPPVPRSVLPEWDPPGEVRGREVTVRVHVDSAGRPTGPVELRPPTPSDDFNRRLRRKVREMRFRPARSGGRPVAGWAELTFVF